MGEQQSAVIYPLTPKLRPRRAHRQSKLQLLTFDRVDRRSNACKVFLRRLGALNHDLGGVEHLSLVQRTMADAYVGATILLENMITRTLLGEAIDPIAYATVVTAMTRLAMRLGVQRVKPPKAELSLSEYLAARRSGEAAAEAASAGAREPEDVA